MSALFLQWRTYCWFKNLAALAMTALFLPMSQVFQLSGSLLIAVFGLCLLSSAGYLLNDLIDFHQDKKHPTNSQRPYAAGRFSFALITLQLLALFSTGTLLLFFLSQKTLPFSFGYLFWVALYSAYLKKNFFSSAISISLFQVFRFAVSDVIFSIRAPLSFYLCLFGFFLALAINIRWKDYLEMTTAIILRWTYFLSILVCLMTLFQFLAPQQNQRAIPLFIGAIGLIAISLTETHSSYRSANFAGDYRLSPVVQSKPIIFMTIIEAIVLIAGKV